MRFLALLFFLFIGVFGVAQKQTTTTRILFIYDASNSMNGTWQSGKKNTIARKLLSDALDSLSGQKNLEIALRVYGHQKYYREGQDCNDTKLEVPFAPNNTKAIKNKLNSIVPKGTTPIARTLEKSADDFTPCANCRNIIILITDGIEECNGDPCAVSMALQRKGIILKPFVIGVGLDMEFKSTFECMGNYYDASNEATFREVLDIVISQALNNTSAQVNLLDVAERPVETNIPVMLYDNFSGNLQYNFIHTMNSRGVPDTLSIDPLLTYSAVAYTIPPVWNDSVKLVPGRHSVIALDAPQGYLHVKTPFVTKESIPFIIRKKDSMETVNVQLVNTKEKYLVGFYDLEILTLPRTYLYDVAVSQSHTTTVEIPSAGNVSFETNTIGYGAIFKKEGQKLEWVCNLAEDQSRQTFNLQPGDYVVSFRGKSARETIFTSVKNFTVKAGTTITINTGN